MTRPSILIVDDEKDTCRTLKEFLSKRIECHIQEASNGEEAICMLAKDRYDLMVLDIRMPKKSGIDVLDNIPLDMGDLDSLVITAWDSRAVAEECAARGVECMPKPFKLEELYGKVRRILERKGMYLPR